MLEPATLNIIPPISSPTPKVAPPKTAVPNATPPPPAANDPPPKAASVAFVAAAPPSAEIAVPVEAVPNATTAAVVPPAAAKPPAVPRAAPPSPPRRTLAPTAASFTSFGVKTDSVTLSLLISAKLGTFLIFSNSCQVLIA